ncbi:MAG: hypothetical protein EHM70_03365 [Chloroflexota bacterium]|nr:MAG: hypothetical protein EHM70_03365 [Chloroflexota bacterium]
MDALPDPSKPRKAVLAIVIMSTVISTLCLLPVILTGLTVNSVLQAPGTTESIYARAPLLLSLVILYPLVALAALIGAWLFYRKTSYRAAFYLSLVPLVHIILFILAFFYYASAPFLSVTP